MNGVEDWQRTVPLFFLKRTAEKSEGRQYCVWIAGPTCVPTTLHASITDQKYKYQKPHGSPVL